MQNRTLSVALLMQIMVVLLGLSPPCTIFSDLQRLFNSHKVAKSVFDKRFAQGVVFVDHAMACCEAQINNGRFFFFEHPGRATSWQLASVGRVRKMPGVQEVCFHQCAVGLKSKVHGVPMRKYTRLLTNSKYVVQLFKDRRCDGQHAHQPIHGREGGMLRSTFAQQYPKEMVDLLVQAARMHAADLGLL